MATMHCPYCHIKTSITKLTKTVEHVRATLEVDVSWKDNYGQLWWIGQCNHCLKPVLVMGDGSFVLPKPLPSSTSTDIEGDIRENLVEAKYCMSVNAYRATVVMCRRALQMACIGKGANASDNLVSQINQLKNSGVITADLHEWATVIRWVGNDGAHPGGTAVEKEDAQNMLDLTEQFLYVLYVAPAKAAAHRAKLGK